MALQKIHSHKLHLCRLDLWKGVELISRYASFKQILSQEFSDDPFVALMLANPSKDETLDRITWWSEIEGVHRHISAIDNENEQRAFEMAAKENIRKIKSLAARLKTSKITSDRKHGDFLNASLNESYDYDLYSIDGHPVLVGWGLISGREVKVGEEEAETPPDEPLEIKNDGIDTGADETNIPEPGTGEGSSENTAANSSGNEPGRPIWPWLLAFLGGLLAALLLLLLLWPGLLGSLWGAFRSPGLNIPAFDLNKNREAALMMELSRLKPILFI